MSRYGWPFRWELLVADALVGVSTAWTLGLEDAGPRWLAIAAIGYLLVCMHLFAVVEDGRSLESRLTATLVIKGLANAWLLATGTLLAVLVVAPPTNFGGGIGYVPPPRYLGLTLGDLIVIGGIAMTVVGWILVQRFSRAGAERETHDELWWSRA